MAWSAYVVQKVKLAEILHKHLQTPVRVRLFLIRSILIVKSEGFHDYLGDIPSNSSMIIHTECLPSHIRNGDVCEPCPEGKYSVDHTTCVPCPAGQYYNRTKINRCQPCPVGSTTTEPRTIDITNCSEYHSAFHLPHSISMESHLSFEHIQS